MFNYIFTASTKKKHISLGRFSFLSYLCTR